jgi:hypothetical protein
MDQLPLMSGERNNSQEKTLITKPAWKRRNMVRETRNLRKGVLNRTLKRDARKAWDEQVKT